MEKKIRKKIPILPFDGEYPMENSHLLRYFSAIGYGEKQNQSCILAFRGQ